MFKLFKTARFLWRNRWRLAQAITREVADIVEEEHANRVLLENFTKDSDRKTFDQIGREVVSVEPMDNAHGEPWFCGTRRF